MSASCSQNLIFTLPMESAGDGRHPRRRQGARRRPPTDWLKANPAPLDAWLAGVTTFDGGDGLAAVKAHLGL